MKRRRSGDDGDQSVESSGGSRFTKNLGRCSSPPSPSTSTSTSHHRHLELEEKEEDRISKLPDDILVLILNLMMTNALGKKGEIEQVGRTSLLSRRWRFLWNYSLKSLVFTHDGSYFDIEDNLVHEAAEHRIFVDRVNLILALPVVGDTIDDFNLTFWVSSGQTYWSDYLPGWISFALQKKVKRLSINLEHFENRFTLDNKVIRNHNMDSLVSLCLETVNVTGEFLEYLLTICESLERLSIFDSETLVNFTVSGPSLKLKYLKIHMCFELQHLCIRHVNLVSLDYDPYPNGNHAAVVIEDAPCLVNARLNYFSGKDKTAKVLGYLPRLQTLALIFNSNWLEGDALLFPQLMNLVKLELELSFQVFISTICASLLLSCPFMSELILKFGDSAFEDYEDKVERLKHRHECLKVVELVGFRGCKLHTGVALYLIENTLSLDKIVVDTSDPDQSLETRSEAEQVEDEVCEPKLVNAKLSESELRQVADPVPRTRAYFNEVFMLRRAGARAHAEEHLATILSGTRTQIVIK